MRTASFFVGIGVAAGLGMGVGFFPPPGPWFVNINARTPVVAPSAANPNKPRAVRREGRGRGGLDGKDDAAIIVTGSGVTGREGATGGGNCGDGASIVCVASIRGGEPRELASPGRNRGGVGTRLLARSNASA